MATANVSTSASGTGFTIDVTACNLTTSTAIKDFSVFHAGTLVSNTLYSKLSATSIQYTGSSLGTTSIEVRRKTPDSVLKTITGFPVRVSSTDWNNEFDRVTRRAEEMTLNGIGPSSLVTTFAPINTAYDQAVWVLDTTFSPTRKVISDQFEVKANLASPAFSGNPTAPTQTAGNSSTRIATTAFVDNSFAPLSSPTFSGTVTIPTASVTTLSGSPNFTGNPTVPTQSPGTNNTRIASTAFVTAADAASISNTAFAGSWNGVTDVAPSKDAVYDELVKKPDFVETTSSPVLVLQTPSASAWTYTTRGLKRIRLGSNSEILHVYIDVNAFTLGGGSGGVFISGLPTNGTGRDITVPATIINTNTSNGQSYFITWGAGATTASLRYTNTNGNNSQVIATDVEASNFYVSAVIPYANF